eukprot:TRINITY_DN17160_c0_g1_i1.p1 TRINITY_DN17160_c0_g1~~TRINITY_DN17160_c0_g1_i1.p1  ORF type:complete len:527 (-),score=58.31 TRINITY_DN17160_c0_g1_i1:62-1642(-)
MTQRSLFDFGVLSGRATARTVNSNDVRVRLGSAPVSSSSSTTALAGIVGDTNDTVTPSSNISDQRDVNGRRKKRRRLKEAERPPNLNAFSILGVLRSRSCHTLNSCEEAHLLRNACYAHYRWKTQWPDLSLSWNVRPVRTQAHGNRGGVVDLNFDQYGALLAVAGGDGVLRVHNFENYLYAPEGDSKNAELEPLLQLNTKMNMKSVRWCPWNENEVAVSFSSSRHLTYYDLSTCGSTPTGEYRSNAGGGVGIFDFSYLPGKRVLVGGYRDGGLRAWDYRTHKTQKWHKANPAFGSIKSLATSADDNAIYTGTQNGTICIWDVRFNARVVRTLDIHAILESHHNDAGGVDVPRASLRPSSIECVRFDPGNEQLLGVVLDSRYMCAVDLCTQKLVSDVVLVNEDCVDDGENDNAGEHSVTMSASFTPSGGVLAVGDGMNKQIVFCDLTSSACIGSHKSVRRNEITLSTTSEIDQLGPPLDSKPWSVGVPTKAPVCAIHCHPKLDYIATGLADGSVGLLKADREETPED